MRSLVLLSGGMDSATAYLQAVRRYGADHVAGLYCHYGSKHGPKECQYARYVAQCYGGVLLERYLGDAFARVKSSLLNGNAGEMSGSATVVPGRNRLLIETALDEAVKRGGREIVFSPHRGDAAIYEDCRPAFVAEMRVLCEARGVRLRAPWLRKTKRQVVEIGNALGINWDWTWSCYSPTRLQVACGTCGACVEREKAFAAI